MIKRKVNGKYYTMDNSDFVKYGHETETPLSVTVYHFSFLQKGIIKTSALFKFTFECNKPEWQSITSYLEDLGIKPECGFTSKIFYKIVSPDETNYKFSNTLEIYKIYQIMKTLKII